MNKPYITISEAMEFTTLSRSTLYQLSKRHPGLFRKVGVKRVVVDVQKLAAIIEGNDGGNGENDGSENTKVIQ